MAESTREKILMTAGRLFFEHGYRAIGIDTIIAESGIAKATLYRHFPSKDELIVAYLEDTNGKFWAWFESAAEQYPDDPHRQLVAIFLSLQKLVTTPSCYGCPFIIAAGEYPDSQHSVHRVAQANKEALQARLSDICQQMKIAEPQHLANQLFLLMDGAFAAVRMFGIKNPAVQIGAYAEQIINCARNL